MLQDDIALSIARHRCSTDVLVETSKIQGFSDRTELYRSLVRDTAFDILGAYSKHGFQVD